MIPIVRNILFTSVLAMAAAVFSPGLTNATTRLASVQPRYTSAQIRRIAREAHTVEQYTQLADYYQTKHRLYPKRAAEMMGEWARRNEVIAPLYEKYPHPVDSARNLHEYYRYEAVQASAKVALYNRLADEVGAQASSNWSEQWYRANDGRSSLSEEMRLKDRTR